MTEYCFVDGVCYADGAARSLCDGVLSTCQYCDISLSTDAWSLRNGFILEEDKTTRNEDELRDEYEDLKEAKVLAAYVPKTNVSSHARIDLDAREIRELAAQSDFESALFVYEKGGNGLCSEDGILSMDTKSSCCGKTVDDAKGNSVSSSGSIRTIHGIALFGPSNMADRKLYQAYRNFWGDEACADTFVQNALSPTGGRSSRSDAMRAELGAKGAVYQARWMYMVHEMEEAIAQCKMGNTFVSDTSTSAPHRWDEFWAFYAGPLEGSDGSGDGEFMWALAEKRYQQFATCDPRGRTALANEQALELASSGLKRILAADCTGAEDDLNATVHASTIPFVQGLLKHIYDADPDVNGGVCTGSACTYDELWAEGWAFAAAVLPRINKCDADVAQLVRENLDVDSAEKLLKDGYRVLKAQIETTYSCLGITWPKSENTTAPIASSPVWRRVRTRHRRPVVRRRQRGLIILRSLY